MNLPVQEHPVQSLIREAIRQIGESGGWREYTGPQTEELARTIANSTSRMHAKLCCSGTFAVELAIRALHLKPHEEVLLCAYDFPGNFRAIEDAGAKVALCDISTEGWTIDLSQLEQSISCDTRAILVSHLHGSNAPMQRICRIAAQHGLCVIEDACQAHGAIVDGKPAGSWGDLSVFSFGGSKLISAGRGGAVVTNDDRLFQRMKIFCDRGNDAFALSELQSALLLPQYTFLAQDHSARLSAAERLIAGLRSVDWLTMPTDSTTIERGRYEPAYYKFGMKLNEHALKLRVVRDWLERHAVPENDERYVVARDLIVRQLEKHDITIGIGFRGFLNRTAHRCRRPLQSSGTATAASRTMLLHHNHLLDLTTGACDVERVIQAFESTTALLQQEL